MVNRPTPVTVICIVTWVLGALGALGTIFSMMGSALFGFMGNNAMMGRFLVGGALVGLVIIAAVSYVAWEVWNLKEWARLVFVILGALGVISILMLNIVGAVLGGIVVYYFQFDPKVKSAFR